MRLPRYRLRTPMVILAGMALVMGLGLRAFRLRERSRFHHDRESFFRLLSTPNRCATGDFQDGLLKVVDGPDGFSEVRPASPRAESILKEREVRRAARKRAFAALQAYHKRRARAFERAWLLPWASVPFDPPPSEPE
jgi:hypothetical protein